MELGGSRWCIPTAIMGTYLENYLESVSSLPSEVKRNFALLRQLDTSSQSLIEEVESNAKAYIKTAKKKRETSTEEEDAIKEDLKNCLRLGDEKVQLAVQTYELVDKHIRRLDQDLKKFEAELEQGGSTIIYKETKQPEKPPVVTVKGNGKASTQRKKAAIELPTSDARVLNVDIDMPIDPNEPTYCTCNRVSFGEMVGCDSQDCKVEWFHFECVGLTTPPKGKWFCPECTALRKKQLHV